MDFDPGTDRDQQHRFPLAEQPQPTFRVNLTLAVTDVHALWAAAAARLLAAPGMTLEDALDVIGPREDPSVVECIATLAKPLSVPGCIMDDFWIDGLRGAPARNDIAGAVLEYRPASPAIALRRLPHTRRPPQHLVLCLLPPLRDDATTN